MPFTVTCPFCPVRLTNVPDGVLGASVRCPKCDNYFTAAPAEEPVKSLVGARPRRRMTATVGPAPAQRVPMAAAQLGQTGSYLAEIDSPPPPPGPCAIDLWGLGALCLGVAALLGASFVACADYVVPASSLGLLGGLVGLLHRLAKREGRLLLALAGTLVSGLVLLGALFRPGLLGPVFEAARQKDTADPTAIRVVPLPGSHANARNGNGDFADATQAALQQGGTRIQISAVWVGSARPSGKSGDGAGAQHLFVRLHLQQVEKASTFAANNPQLPPPLPKDVCPRLMDEGGKAYANQETVDVSGLENVRASTVFPMMLRDEVLVFAPPAAGVAYLRLDVPAPAGGSFHFVIPGTMIRWKKTGE